ncbi:MAG: ATP-dependent zinc metalloprotease FtsH [Defluviitaleaceae bacterium]|nr:ATP-dependent zinc metalloprotease FtsH [Defluviitaleaceae bacterium]
MFSMIRNLTNTNDDEEPFTYAHLLQALEAGEVESITLTPSMEVNNVGQAEVQIPGIRESHVVEIPNISGFEEFLRQVWETHPETGIYFNPPRRPSIWLQALPFVLVFGGSLIVLMLVLRHMQGGGMGNRGPSFGRSRARVSFLDKRKVTFDQVAGLEEEKAEMSEIVNFLKSPQRYSDIGARIPKGVLLVGPPGTGKTFLARAVAGEANVPFYSISGSDFVELYVGVGASRVRDLFDQAKRSAPSLIIIDEVDAVGRRRGAGVGGGHDEREQTLNQLLVEMDGFAANEGVIVIAATNRPDILDPALLRPGRFDRRIVVNPPDVKGREAVLGVHSEGKQLDTDVDLKVVAQTTAGFTPADLENLMNESALLAARDEKTSIDMESIRKAFIKVVVGTEKKSRVITEKERKITAYHEAGHAICHEVMPDLDATYMISIIPTGRAGGYVMSLPSEDKAYHSKRFMEQGIVSLLGGRVAEALVLGDITSGAANDIERATGMARNMVVKFGMSETLGPIQFGNDNEEVFIGRDLAHSRNYSEEVASQIDNEIKRIVTTAYNEAMTIIQTHSDVLHKIVELLMEKERVSGEEVRKLFPPGTLAAKENKGLMGEGAGTGF